MTGLERSRMWEIKHKRINEHGNKHSWEEWKKTVNIVWAHEMAKKLNGTEEEKEGRH